MTFVVLDLMSKMVLKTVSITQIGRGKFYWTT